MEHLLQTALSRAVVEEAGQRRVSREQYQAAVHLLAVYLAGKHIQLAQPQIILHLGIAVLQALGNVGSGISHTLSLVHRVVLPQEDNAVAIGVAPL